MKKTIIYVGMLVLIMAMVLAEPITITILTPSKTFNDLIVGDTAEGIISVVNYNNFDVSVSLVAPDFNLESDTVDLEPDEKYNFEYEKEIIESGSYSYTIPVIFSTEAEEVGLKQISFGAVINFKDVVESPAEEPEIIITEQDEEDEDKETNENCRYFSQCYNEPWLDGCHKQDCNWCCYNICTVQDCNYEPRVATQEEIEEMQNETNITCIGCEDYMELNMYASDLTDDNTDLPKIAVYEPVKEPFKWTRTRIMLLITTIFIVVDIFLMGVLIRKEYIKRKKLKEEETLE